MVDQLVFTVANRRDGFDFAHRLLDVGRGLLRLSGGEQIVDQQKVMTQVMAVDGRLFLNGAQQLHLARGLQKLRFQQKGLPLIRLALFNFALMNHGKQQEKQNHRRGQHLVNEQGIGKEVLRVHAKVLIQVIQHRQCPKPAPKRR